MSFLLKKDFISKEGESNLPNYKYSGTDKSILYKHVFSPTAEFVVQNFIPNWLAPNVITLVGFLCTLIPHFLVWNAAGNSIGGEVPSSLWFLTAIGQFTYMILDNADGKQARKTKSSSPLGLLFDHGCDAMNTFVTAITFFTALNLGNGGWSIFGYFITFSSFFLATWEEYYCEELVLGVINGVNEGLAGIGFMFIITGIFGSNIWLTKIFDFQLNHIIVICFTTLAVVTLFGHFQTVKIKAPELFNDAIKHLATYALLGATCFIVYNFSLSNVLATPACRFFIYFIGFSFAKLVGILQASHTAHVPFNQFRTSIILPCLLINGIIILGAFRGKPITNEISMIYIAALFSLIAHVHFILNIIKQFCRVLNINCLRIRGPNDIPLNQDKTSETKPLRKQE